MKHRSVIIVGKQGVEVRIYTLRRRDGYVSHQTCWREASGRQTRTFADLEEAKLFAQQKTVALANVQAGAPPEVSLREIELLRACESRVTGFGLTVAAAVEEWYSAKSLLGGGPLGVAAQHQVLPRGGAGTGDLHSGAAAPNP